MSYCCCNIRSLSLHSPLFHSVWLSCHKKSPPPSPTPNSWWALTCTAVGPHCAANKKSPRFPHPILLRDKIKVNQLVCSISKQMPEFLKHPNWCRILSSNGIKGFFTRPSKGQTGIPDFCAQSSCQIFLIYKYILWIINTYVIYQISDM